MTKRVLSLGGALIATLSVSTRAEAAAPKQIVVIVSPSHAVRDDLVRELRLKDFRVDVLAGPLTGCFGEDVYRLAGNASAVVCVDEQVHLFVRRGRYLKHSGSLPIVNNNTTTAALRAAETMRVRLEAETTSALSPATPSESLAEWDDSAPVRPDVHLPPLPVTAACDVDKPLVIYVTSPWHPVAPAPDASTPEAPAESQWQRYLSVALGSGFVGDLDTGDLVNSVRASVSAAPLPWLVINTGAARFFSSLESPAAPRGAVNAGLRFNLSNKSASVQAGLGAAAVYRFKIEEIDGRFRGLPRGSTSPRTVGSEWVATPYVDGALDLRLADAVGLSFEARLYGLEASSAGTWATPIETNVLLSYTAF